MIGYLASNQNKFEGSTKVLLKFEGDRTHSGPSAPAITNFSASPAPTETTIINPMLKGTYCTSALGSSSSYTCNLITGLLSNQSDYSIDLMFYTSTFADTNKFIYSWVRPGYAECYFYVKTDGSLAIGYNGGNLVSAAGVIAINTWYHIMFKSVSTVGQFWVNGVMVKQGSPVDFCCSAAGGTIGQYRLGGGGVCNIKNFRVCIPAMKNPRPI